MLRSIFMKWIFLFLFSCCWAFAAENQEACKRAALPIVSQIPGWCSQKKAAAIMDLIFETKPKVCVEIGVFAGASLFPTAMALKCLEGGMVYAIDPWDNYEATRFFPPDNPHHQYWKQVDFPRIYQSFQNLIAAHHLENHCCVIRLASEKAAFLFRTIDILHIDSTHSDESALSDVSLYLPKVRVGGYVWFDGWNAAPSAFELAKKTCHVKKVLDEGKCILLEKVSE